MNQSDRIEQNPDESGAGAVAVDNDAPPKIFKLNVDCFDQIFDYLSYRDIHAMSATCKVMQQVAGHYFQQNFRDAVKHIYMWDDDTSFDGFTQFFSKLCIVFPVQKILKAGMFPSLRDLKLAGFDFDLTQFSNVKDILSNVEVLDLQNIDITDDFYKQTLNSCTKLKCLHTRFDSLHQIEITKNLLQKNSTLERIDISGGTPADFSEGYSKLISFVEQNPNVKLTINITAKDFWANKNSFAESNIQLDCLSIIIRQNHEQSHQFADLLIRLNERGFYKKLDLHSEVCSQEFVNRVASIKKLQSILFYRLVRRVDLSPLVHLKELAFVGIVDYRNMDMDTLANNLVNLEKLIVEQADAIIPFLRHSRKLKTVKVYGRFVRGDLIKNDILELAALNEQRQKLNRARKVSIFVEEKVYLATKWATKYWNLNLIEIKRDGPLEL